MIREFTYIFITFLLLEHLFILEKLKLIENSEKKQLLRILNRITLY